MTGLTFGVVPGAGVDVDHLARLEDLPIDALWMGGHVASPNPSPEVMMALAVLGARTRRVRIGTSILLLPLYAPAIVAKQVADLDNLTGGRVTLGVGIGGEYPGEFRACQVPIAERGPRTDEAIPLLRRLWTGEPVTHDGRFYAMEDVRIHPAPAQAGGPPIVVAGRQPPAMRRAAALGDGWMPYLYSPRRYAESVTVIREHAERVGRTLDHFEWCAFVFVGIDADGDRGTRRHRPVPRRHVPPGLPGHGRPRRRGGRRRRGEGVAATIRRRRARHLILAPASPDPGATIERLFAEVIPRLSPAA